MKLLLHMCCAPCSIYPTIILNEENIYCEGLFYNPNIHPIEEYVKRKENVAKFGEINNLTIHYEDHFCQNEWANFKGTIDERCMMCYNIRLKKTALFAKEHRFDAFSTSLLVSPYQKHDLIKELGEKYAKEFGVAFFYRDFRTGFRQGQQLAKDYGLYRQKYCGCIKSL